MAATPHAEVNALLGDALQGLHGALGDALAGVYLYGSAVLGDFDPTRSDVDLLVACTREVAPRLGAIDAWHSALVRAHPAWDDRIDALFAPLAALREPRANGHTLAFVSPGEPLHLRESGELWLLNWHLVRERGVALFGPPVSAWIAPTTPEDFVSAVRAHLRGWPVWIGESDRPGFHAYAVLTICRALHACRTGTQASKPEAARWTMREHPQWAPLVTAALALREAPTGRDLGSDAASFVEFARRETNA
ncbi:MAG: aminoglycoside adenylyltransferase domain-containing protein [Myxococcota bacterium]